MHPIASDFQKRAVAAVSNFKSEISGVRANRPTPALVENIPVTCYGQTMPMKHVASITVIPPREISVQAWDKEALPAIVKAIEAANIGLSPRAEGTSIRMFLPELSEERREELAKHIRKLSETARISIRGLREDANKEVQRAFDAKDITEDDRFKIREEIQKHTDAANRSIEDSVAQKIAEVSS